MDYIRPVEAIIPGAQGRVLAVLARVERPLSVTAIARLAGLSRNRTSDVLSYLTRLGVVSRTDAGHSELERSNAAGRLVADLAELHPSVLRELTQAARRIRPQPASLIIYGSFARGEATADSDVDMLAVRPDAAEASDEWVETLGRFTLRAERLIGNRVSLVEYNTADLAARLSDNHGPGRSWLANVVADAVLLVGSPLGELDNGHVTAR